MLPPRTRFSKVHLFIPERPAGRQSPISRVCRLPEPVPSSVVTPAISKCTRRSGGAHRLKEQAVTILKWALIFFVVSIVAGVLGFTGLSDAAADIARFLFYVFVVIFLVLLILGLTIFRV
jgi:uncharacterized membrane protein YtjA (UPF0391 family)